jgi:hypothetical protein
MRNVCSVGATAGSTNGIDFGMTSIGWSAIVLQFQGCAGKNTFKGAISFSAKRRTHRCPNQGSKEGGIP